MAGYCGWAFDGDGDQCVILGKVCVRGLLLLHLRSGDRLGGPVGVYLRADDHCRAVCRPGEGECFAADVELAYAGLGAYIPEAYCAVCRATGQLCVSDWVEEDLLDAGGVAAQFGGVADIGAIGVPDSQSAIC